MLNQKRPNFNGKVFKIFSCKNFRKKTLFSLFAKRPVLKVFNAHLSSQLFNGSEREREYFK
jgi:hypothetical protein